jgi:CRP/FNR family cyclic AMP-dependent transcriptional regulator
LPKEIDTMKEINLIEAIQNHPFVKDFRPQHLEKLAELARHVRFERDHIIFREGDESSFFYLILSGKVALEVTALGRTLRVQTLGEGEELGWSSVIPAQGKHFQARALGVVSALVFDGAQLREACDQDCSFGYALLGRLLGVVAERLQATRIQLLDMYSPSGAKEI